MLLAGLALVGCGSDGGEGDPQAAQSPSASPSASPSVEPSPTPGGPDRSPEVLVELLEFAAPEFGDPTVQEAVDGYEEYLRQYMVAQGLPDADYPPLRAALDPAFADAALVSTVQAARDGYLYVGPYVEEVLDATGGQDRVVITNCADLSQREIYRADSGAFVQKADAVVTPVTVTMTKGAQQWVLSGYERNESVECS